LSGSGSRGGAPAISPSYCLLAWLGWLQPKPWPETSTTRPALGSRAVGVMGIPLLIPSQAKRSEASAQAGDTARAGPPLRTPRLVARRRCRKSPSAGADSSLRALIGQVLQNTEKPIDHCVQPRIPSPHRRTSTVTRCQGQPEAAEILCNPSDTALSSLFVSLKKGGGKNMCIDWQGVVICCDFLVRFLWRRE
jgi:hypothetical protein